MILISIALVLGALVGSFLNVVILRGIQNESFGGRSRCESCRKELTPLELIPIISFCIQKGRCRSCGVVLSLQYPLVEFFTAVSFAVSAWIVIGTVDFAILSLTEVLKNILFLAGYGIGISAAIVVLVSDLRFQIIPNGAVILLTLLGGIAAITRATAQQPIPLLTPSYVEKISSLAYDASFAILFALLFFLLWFFSRGHWIGLGDTKLIFATSLVVGFPQSLTAFLFSFWSGGIAGVLLILLEGKGLKSHIPFGPFILFGSVLSLFLTESFLSLTKFSFYP